LTVLDLLNLAGEDRW